VVFALAFYLLRDSGRFSRWAVQFGDGRGIFKAYGRAVDASLKQIYFGNILNAIVTGAIGAITFSLLNFVAPPGLAIPYPALTGLLAGVASLVPIVGMKLVYVPVVGYLGFRAALQGGNYSFVVVVFLVSLVVVDTLPDLVLRPYVSGRNLHVGLVMFAYILGPLLFGWYGIFLGPLVLVLVVHFARIVLPELITRERIRPVAVDPGNLRSGKAPPTPNETDVGVSDGGTPGAESAPEE
jgi:predicted PurR-regulated permease PerM